ncbi:ABC transporter ATP-binding protein [Oleidesulfovibrio alaskensis]|jgi:peptide/nickel transport system ATP-binding protein|uniref:ATP-binding cassette domain-containing protein n=1 Tax=Oleidesulfovibrio alaskensis TaxID=58180 RepID=UPI001A39535A|nr:ABC transporter ATP-binding protein [Oleidesulfovibrio alaskensis]MBL3583668.1 ABC transporter ATP-binding protein [Oleidesulfovibrio alaskensis]
MLEIRNLSVEFSTYSAGLRRHSVPAIRSLDLTAQAGTIAAVVGQSGAGKSLLAHAVLGILPANATCSGDMFYNGRRLTPRSIRSLRGKEIALIPQSVSFLNPLLKVGVQVARAGICGGMSAAEARSSAQQALQRYGLPRRTLGWFPFQLSGGMTRRVLTATATIGSASLLIADEPTNGLDPLTARETLGHLRSLADTGKAVILITHDIEAALSVADSVTVFCGGVTVEEARASDFDGNGSLRHPYSRTLWESLPRNGFTQAVPQPETAPQNGGCPFSGACLRSNGSCRETLPELTPLSGGKVRCWNA